MKINRVYGGATHGPSARQREAVLGGDWDTPHVNAFEDSTLCRPSRITSCWDRLGRDAVLPAAADAIKQGVQEWDCPTVEAFHARLDGIDRLFVRIHRDGFKSQVEIEDGDPWDEIRIAIRRDGRFLLVDGRHRLAIARLLGTPRVPGPRRRPACQMAALAR